MQCGKSQADAPGSQQGLGRPDLGTRDSRPEKTQTAHRHAHRTASSPLTASEEFRGQIRQEVKGENKQKQISEETTRHEASEASVTSL